MVARICTWSSWFRIPRIVIVLRLHTGVSAGNRGLDVDELAAFMRNLDLDLSPSEAMLVSRVQPRIKLLRIVGGRWRHVSAVIAPAEYQPVLSFLWTGWRTLRS